MEGCLALQCFGVSNFDPMLPATVRRPSPTTGTIHRRSFLPINSLHAPLIWCHSHEKYRITTGVGAGRTQMSRILAICLVLVLGGCATYSESYQTDSLLGDRTASLSRTANIVVAVEGDGRYANIVTQGSGAKTRDAMSAAISKYASNVSSITGFVSEKEARADAQRRGADYLVYLRILNWEERQTVWSGRPDRLESEIRLVDAKSSKVLESIIIRGNSKWATLGGDHVDHLLSKPFSSYAASLFGIEAEK